MKSDLINPLTDILTRRELETLIYLTHFFKSRQRMPTHNEMRIDLNLQSNGFRYRILEKLKDLGYLKPAVKQQIAYTLIEEIR